MCALAGAPGWAPQLPPVWGVRRGLRGQGLQCCFELNPHLAPLVLLRGSRGPHLGWEKQNSTRNLGMRWARVCW